MTAMHDTLLLSSAHQAAPDIQCRREQGLLLRARRGEIHLHVSPCMVNYYLWDDFIPVYLTRARKSGTGIPVDVRWPPATDF